MCSKWSNDLVQDKGIKRGIDCIGFELKGPLEYQVKIERCILSMCKRGPIQLYLGQEVRTTKKTKESYYNLETTWVATPFVSRIKGLHGRL
jgi:hypothetical protein